jgi:hypothetical protein
LWERFPRYLAASLLIPVPLQFDLRYSPFDIQSQAPRMFFIMPARKVRTCEATMGRRALMIAFTGKCGFQIEPTQPAFLARHLGFCASKNKSCTNEPTKNAQVAFLVTVSIPSLSFCPGKLILLPQ